MEWDSKASLWNLENVDGVTLPNIETMEESLSSIGVVYKMKDGFSVDLKLGHEVVGNSGTESITAASKMAPSSSKRARAFSSSTLTVSCLVDGCNSDLSKCRDYHRRHKVCELHSKTPEVTIGGLKQRFCQQCSRFHSLEQFDERKRSCRKRLDGHNRRRRKPQTDPVMRPAGSFLSSYQGTQLLPFSSSTVMVNPWSCGHITSCAGGRLDIHNNNQQQVQVVEDIYPGSSSTSYEERNQLGFLQGYKYNPSTATLNSDNQVLQPTRSKMLCDSLITNTSVLRESHCALSLLSSSHTHTRVGNGLDQIVQQPHSMSLMQPLRLSLHGNSFDSMDQVLVPNGSESDHCSSMYNMGSSEGSQGNQAPQLFPYQWE